MVKGLWAEVWRVGRREELGRWKERLLSSGWVVCHVQTTQSKLQFGFSLLQVESLNSPLLFLPVSLLEPRFGDAPQPTRLL